MLYIPFVNTSVPSSFRGIDLLASIEYNKFEEMSLSFAVIKAISDPTRRFSSILYGPKNKFGSK